MIVETKYSRSLFQICAKQLLELWTDNSNKVFVLRAELPPSDIKEFYFKNFKWLGKPFPLGEDATKGREEKSSGSIWFEVRNDSSIPNAYRHSTEPQPLHTDGSYIPNFPSSTIMACVNNNAKGGETVFIDSIKLFEIIESDDPSLLNNLMSENFLHERSGLSKKQPIIRDVGNDVYVNWNFYCISRQISAKQKIIANQFHNFLKNNKNVESAKYALRLMPGDSVFWRDDLCLHGRNGFFAKNTSDRFLWKCAIDIGNFID
tara:strand:- start:10714 stop:11496 length:783 start_codon:yes stop_codon:yes gene_type:complete